ncbi:sugar kinase [Streptomyces sp. NPDC002537]
MVTFRPARPAASGRLVDVPAFERGVGGAESNVACGLAAAGHRVRWVGRVGADGFGEYVVAAVAAFGVDVAGVQRDFRRPTGVYFRTAGERAFPKPGGAPGPPAVPPLPPAAESGLRPRPQTPDGLNCCPDGLNSCPDGVNCCPDGLKGAHPVPGPPLSDVLYYRSGSAASAMSPANLPPDSVGAARILHLTGITPALSPDCLALTRELTRQRAGRPVVSFDVNYRAPLWQGGGAAVLVGLARACDIVFVGEDEAEAAWGVRGGADAVRAVLPEPGVLVVKQGAAGATAYVREGGADRVVTVPALRVDVVAPVGAGDAFAAGFLSGTLRGLPVEERLRHGHLMAAAALTTAEDLAAPPPRPYADRLVALDDAAWGRLRLGPGWTMEDRTA